MGGGGRLEQLIRSDPLKGAGTGTAEGLMGEEDDKDGEEEEEDKDGEEEKMSGIKMQGETERERRKERRRV